MDYDVGMYLKLERPIPLHLFDVLSSCTDIGLQETVYLFVFCSIVVVVVFFASSYDYKRF